MPLAAEVVPLLDPFMSIDSNETLLAVLRRTQVLAPEQVEEVTRELVPHYPHPQDLGEYLVEIDWLTAYQLQLLFVGEWENLTIGPYQILDRLGEGGISEVFKAWDTLRGRVVALKVLRQHLASKSEIVRQFQRELQAITRLSHPNVIKTFEASQEGRRHFFAMEFVEGMDLDRYTQQMGPLPLEQACEYVRQAATGLQHAHQAGLVHRDIKPANLFLVHPPLPATQVGGPAKRPPDPVVKIIDWGLARCLRDPADQGDQPQASAEELDAEKGSLIGTADYIAPEQAREASLVDIRADIYSLGCTLFYLLTGHPPFQGTTLMQKLLQHQEADPPSLRAVRDDVPEDLDALVRKMLAKSPEDRLQIPLMVVTALRKFCTVALTNNGMPIRPGGSANGMLNRPGSSSSLQRPSSSSSLQRPSSSSSLQRPTPAPGTSVNLPRPGTHGTLNRPGTSTNLPRPGQNGNGHHR